MSNTPVKPTLPPAGGDLIDNPFIPLKHVNPLVWPNNIFDLVSPILLHNWEVPLGLIPEPNEDLSYYAEDVHDLIAELDEDRADITFLHERTPNLLSRILAWLAAAKGVEEDVVGTLPEVILHFRDQDWSIITIGGQYTTEQDIYVYTDAICRGMWRDMETLGDECMSRLCSEYPVQDDDDLDPLDLAVLIAMAQERRALGVWADEYTVHVVYPNAAFDHLFVLRAIIPLSTLQAIERNNEKMPPMRICRGVVPLHVDVEKPLQDNALTKVLAALMDPALEIAATVVEEP
ncbi:hypothetical protein Hypma_004404 [Hypsizygus marmoreus]|uniref:Uncharacterized protein n=1 Tax=Hypsizygus marmoreus TaxID=39966 RepID=A0A369K6A3_HYPMA|nr:hypothetical protein Hypma_004404 [Hypsizygus marmoreus]